MPLLQASAQAAAQSCSGGTDGVTCGTKWYTAGWDNTYGVGQQMNALEIFQAQLIDTVRGPLTNSTGGTSQGDPSAGTGGDSKAGVPTSAITTSDKAGAGIVTALILVGILGGAWCVFLPFLGDVVEVEANADISAGGWWARPPTSSRDEKVAVYYEDDDRCALHKDGMSTAKEMEGWIPRTLAQSATNIGRCYGVCFAASC